MSDIQKLVLLDTTSNIKPREYKSCNASEARYYENNTSNNTSNDTSEVNILIRNITTKLGELKIN